MKVTKHLGGRLLAGVAALAACTAMLVIPVGGHVTQAASTTTVTWLVRTDPVINPWEKTTIAAFEQTHPSIKVQEVLSPGGTSYDQKLLTMVASGSPPSIFSHWGSDSWADFAYRGLAADLTPYIKASGFSLNGINKSALAQYSIDGDVYGIPFAGGGSYVFYNADLLKAAHLPVPTTNWNDKSWNQAALLKYAQAMTKNPTNPSKGQWGVYDNLWPENANSWLFGGDIYPASSYKTGVINTVAATSSPVLQAVQWQADIIHKDKVALNPADTTAVSAGTDPFLSGRVGMEMTGIWGFWVFQPAKFKWGAAPLPYFKSNKDVIFTDPWIMSKNAQNAQAAWTFLQYLVSPQYGEKTYVGTSGVYPEWSQLDGYWATMMSKRTTLTPEQLTQLGAGSVAKGQESINHLAINYGQFDTAVSNILQPVWTGSTTPQKGVQNLQTQLMQIIKQANIKPGGYVSQH